MVIPVGRKIGFTNRSIWKKYGVHEPIWGFVYDETLIFSRKNKASVSLRGLANPRIEPEICFKLASVPPRTSDPERLLAAIEWVAHSIDILSNQADAPALAAGEIISTGTLTDAHPVAPGETWTTELAGLPLQGLEIRFA